MPLPTHFARALALLCLVLMAIGVARASEPLFSVDGTPQTEDHLPASLQQALFDARLAHYKKQLEIIDAALLELAIERRAKAAGQTPEALVRTLFAVPTPSDADVEAFYNEHKARIRYPLNAVRDQLRQMMVQRGIQAKKAELVATFKRESIIDIGIKKPVAPYANIATDGLPSKGNASAKVTLIEFADYQCPHCKQAAGVLGTIAKRFPNDLRVVFMDLPINPSGISRAIAEGAACADQQGRFWEFHDLAFERQSALVKGSAVQFANELKLDADAFQRCLNSEFPKQRVAKSEDQARALGLSSTPTLFLNGRKLHVHNMEAELVEAIEKALGEKAGA